MKKFSAIAQTFILTSFSALSLLAVSPAQAASFMGLGFLDFNNQYRSSKANGISADGSVVVGISESQAFRWTQTGGIVGLGYLDSDILYSAANAVSADGSVIAGDSRIAEYSYDIHGYKYISGYKYQAFRWTQLVGMVNLGTILGGRDGYNFANAISADGSVIVGDSANTNGRGEAFRWTQADGMLSLGFGTASGISADGSILVGSSLNTGGIVEAFRWTQAEGMVSLGTLPPFSSNHAYGVSADGSVVVGNSFYNDNNSTNFKGEAFRWTQARGMVGLGYLTGDNMSQTYGASADGSIVVGSSVSRNNPIGTYDTRTAFRWTQSSGMVNLKDQLTGFGLNLSGWQLNDATGVSADGFTIVGNGTNPSGNSEAWIANLSPEPIPEPLTILGSIAAIAFAASFERKFSKNKSDEKDPDS
jgi:probable HAF family extracellular repeat protein